ncbi:MAG: hypothetical protein LKG19_02405 [Saprospiraceae bacterium]|jgi:hypothetical protein|nr:hypothetical protein [Saprospiraceae bacterium]
MTKKPLLIIFILIVFKWHAVGQLNTLENIDQLEKGGLKKTLKNFIKDFYDFGDPFQMGGGVSLNLRSYNNNGAPLRQDPFFYTLGANLNFKIYQIDIPFSMVMTAKNTNKSYPSLSDMINSLKDQAKSKVNGYARFGISPHYKWAKLHIGHRSMNFSKYTMSNLNFFGTGLELNPGKVRLSGMYGRLAKAEPINLSLTSPNLPIYKRIGWSTKLGYGNDKASADVIVFAAKDDENSISIPAVYPKQKSPEANFAVGIQLQKLLLEKIRLKVDYTRSGVSPNTLDAESDKNSLTNFLLKRRNTTYYGNALEGSVSFEGKNQNSGLSFNRVDSKFKTFGAYFFNTDVFDIQGFTHFGLFQSKLNTSLKLGIQTNNLDGEKPSTTKRLIYDIQTGWSDKAFSAQFNYTNNSSNVSYILNQQLDSLNAVVVTKDIGANLNYVLPFKSDHVHSISLTANIQDVSDDIEKPNRISVSKLFLINAGYTLKTKSKWLFGIRINHTKNEVPLTEVTRFGLGASVQKSLLKEKLSLGFNSNYYKNNNSLKQKSSNTILQITLGAKLFKGASLQFAYGILRTSSDVTPTFTECIGNLGLQYQFNYKPAKKKSKS